jgi:hypothetical protein
MLGDCEPDLDGLRRRWAIGLAQERPVGLVEVSEEGDTVTKQPKLEPT